MSVQIRAVGVRSLSDGSLARTWTKNNFYATSARPISTSIDAAPFATKSTAKETRIASTARHGLNVVLVCAGFTPSVKRRTD
eukprot:478386-Amorphochlora_amoeboformis.AAC.2